jgi:hypothetical protein
MSAAMKSSLTFASVPWLPLLPPSQAVLLAYVSLLPIVSSRSGIALALDAKEVPCSVSLGCFVVRLGLRDYERPNFTMFGTHP